MASDGEVAARAELSHERLEVYGVALQLVAAVGVVLAGMRRGPGGVGAQLAAAAASVPANIAEGAGRGAPRDKAHFYRIARGSAAEVAAHLDVARLWRLAGEPTCGRARALVVRVVAMLTRLAERAESEGRP